MVAGLIFGFLSGLGIGGGSLLMLWLTLILGVDPGLARGINLLFFVPAALCASIFRFQQGHLPLKKLVLPILSGCAFAALGTFAAGHLDIQVLKKMFGLLLLITGVRELLYRPKEFK